MRGNESSRLQVMFFSFYIRWFLKNTAVVSLALLSERVPGLARSRGRSTSMWTQRPLYGLQVSQEKRSRERGAAGVQDSLGEVHQGWAHLLWWVPGTQVGVLVDHPKWGLSQGPASTSNHLVKLHLKDSNPGPLKHHQPVQSSQMRFQPPTPSHPALLFPHVVWIPTHRIRERKTMAAWSCHICTNLQTRNCLQQHWGFLVAIKCYGFLLRVLYFKWILGYLMYFFCYYGDEITLTKKLPSDRNSNFPVPRFSLFCARNKKDIQLCTSTRAKIITSFFYLLSLGL